MISARSMNWPRVSRNWRRGSPGASGFHGNGLADEESDYDLYAYTRETVPVEFRAQLLKPRAARLELHNTF
jgi:hypothetical protein